eukprot:CAMPEP_0196170110 /NCGR_PEP_ID=MMETSP0911-20130528/4516_1 /TAXON_ID=49265 /ORGANISM="Thalassiosira rotula, Strain GSO102" /LENGTH=41 /DNA_ID= /DNA_START= /DNA_END= /DNA_ORIENTATION=
MNCNIILDDSAAGAKKAEGGKEDLQARFLGAQNEQVKWRRG